MKQGSGVLDIAGGRGDVSFELQTVRGIRSVYLSLAHSLSYSLTQSLTRRLAPSLPHSLTHSLTPSLTHHLARSFAYACTHSFHGIQRHQYECLHSLPSQGQVPALLLYIMCYRCFRHRRASLYINHSSLGTIAALCMISLVNSMYWHTQVHAS